jgi:hypothetical protein
MGFLIVIFVKGKQQRRRAATICRGLSRQDSQAALNRMAENASQFYAGKAPA